MKPGVKFVKEVDIWVVRIEDRGGDSAGDCTFASEEEAILASALDRQNLRPRRESAWLLSDGTHIQPRPIQIFPGPSKEDLKDLKAKMEEKLPPAVWLLLEKRTQ